MTTTPKGKTSNVIDTSYDALSILDVCAAATDYLREQKDAGSINNLSASISVTIRHAIGLLGHVHDALEKTQINEVRHV